jgi:glycerate 2-kinase
MTMTIKNLEQLATNPGRKQALLIAQAGLAALNTSRLVEERLQYHQRSDTLTVRGQKFDLKNYQRVIVVGIGKGALQTVAAIKQILGSRISDGVVIDVAGGELDNIGSYVGTYPYPSLANVSATAGLVEMLQACTEQDLVLMVIGAGSYSLLCSPADMTCEQEYEITQALIQGGASIRELATARKHISRVKGGQLAKICHPATVISLIFSDIMSNDFDLVADGPTVKDRTTLHEAEVILQKYRVLERCKLPSCNLLETPKDDKYFTGVSNILFSSAEDVLQAMQNKARDLGLRPRIWQKEFQGRASQFVDQFVRETIAGECLLAAGDIHVKGRLALPDLSALTDSQVLVALGSGSHDNPEAAGLMADHDQLGDLIEIDSSGYSVPNLLICLK